MARPDDAPAVAAIYRPSVTDSPVSFELEAPSAREMQARIERTLQAYPWLVYERDGDVLGYAYGSRHAGRAAYRWSADVSVYVRPDAMRTGIGRALYQALLPMLRNLGYRQAFAGITVPNAASVGLHEALAFTPVGVFRRVGYKLDAWHDVGWWQLELSAEPPAGDPVPFWP
ncbi:MAG: N-acetyltransferase family protein [Dehalococcoidia bacterium]|nr:N-acetyltransferase family protein [Dehalococcoidia bacterium]